MDHKNHCKCSKSSGGNGFMAGIVVGALIVFLLFTKKGRRILKELSEGGYEAIKDIDVVKNMGDLDEEDQGSGDVVEEKKTSSDAMPIKSKVKRFFKGVKKIKTAS